MQRNTQVTKTLKLYKAVPLVWHEKRKGVAGSKYCLASQTCLQQTKMTLMSD